MHSITDSVLISALALLCCASCEETVVSSGKPPAHSAAKPPAPAATASAKAVRDEFPESDFVETEKSRDPFRAYGNLMIEETRTRIRSQRDVVLNEFAVDELKLAGIVTRVEPRAMLVDPTGKGHVVRRGQFVGRPEVVQVGTQAGYEINWRVDRIRPADIVLVREDPKNPDVPTATKVIPLRPEGSLVGLK